MSEDVKWVRNEIGQGDDDGTYSPFRFFGPGLPRGFGLPFSSSFGFFAVPSPPAPPAGPFRLTPAIGAGAVEALSFGRGVSDADDCSSGLIGSVGAVLTGS